MARAGPRPVASDGDLVLTKVRTAVRNVLADGVAVRPEDHFVDDLGFDSAGIASLTIALEDEFDDVLLLSDWIAAGDLTVGSLVDYLLGLFSDER